MSLSRNRTRSTSKVKRPQTTIGKEWNLLCTLSVRWVRLSLRDSTRSCWTSRHGRKRLHRARTQANSEELQCQRHRNLGELRVMECRRKMEAQILLGWDNKDLDLSRWDRKQHRKVLELSRSMEMVQLLLRRTTHPLLLVIKLRIPPALKSILVTCQGQHFTT